MKQQIEIRDKETLFDFIEKWYHLLNKDLLSDLLSTFFQCKIYVLRKPTPVRFSELLDGMFEREAKRIELPIFIFE